MLEPLSGGAPVVTTRTGLPQVWASMHLKAVTGGVFMLLGNVKKKGPAGQSEKAAGQLQVHFQLPYQQ